MKIAFLCGAGAESEFNICSGGEFAKSVLGIAKEQHGVNKLIQQHYISILENCKKSREHPDWYPETCYVQKFNIDTLLKNSIKKEWQLKNKHAKSIKSFEEEVKVEARTVKNITEKRRRIYTTPNYMGILDENFHTIISPRALGPQKFWTVVFAISRAYLAICAGILDIPLNTKRNLSKLEGIFENPNKTYQDILAAINSKNGKFQKESYYSVIKDVFEEYNEKVSVISTNYTPIAQEIIGDKVECISYIHGHIKLFESPYYLQVRDISKDFDRDKFNNEINFPYMFIQSGVKPIVEKTQLEAFSRALSILDKSKVLFVIGYNFNGDDNHINSLLHSYLHDKEDDTPKRKKRILFFDYCQDETKRMNANERLTEIYNQLRIPEHNRYDSELKVNLEIVPINNSNSKAVLRKEIEKYIAI